MRPLLFGFLVLSLACGSNSEPIAPPAEEPPAEPGPDPDPAIVELLIADPDTGLWLGQSLSLSGLIIGAVDELGDTVAAPAVSWSVPDGFARDGDALTATREARGTLVATVLEDGGALAQQVSASIQAAALTDLSPMPWASEHRCYDNPLVMRDAESPPIGLDSVIVNRVLAGDLTYLDTEWTDVRAEIVGDERHIRFWKDGVVDTVFQAGGGSLLLSQDTARADISVEGAVERARQVSADPVVYRVEQSVCEPSYEGGGSAFELRETP